MHVGLNKRLNFTFTLGKIVLTFLSHFQQSRLFNIFHLRTCELTHFTLKMFLIKTVSKIFFNFWHIYSRQVICLLFVTLPAFIKAYVVINLIWFSHFCHLSHFVHQSAPYSLGSIFVNFRYFTQILCRVAGICLWSTLNMLKSDGQDFSLSFLSSG